MTVHAVVLHAIQRASAELSAAKQAHLSLRSSATIPAESSDYNVNY